MLLIRIKDYETNKLDVIQSTLRGKADAISVRKSNLNDVFLCYHSNDPRIKNNSS